MGAVRYLSRRLGMSTITPGLKLPFSSNADFSRAINSRSTGSRSWSAIATLARPRPCSAAKLPPNSVASRPTRSAKVSSRPKKPFCPIGLGPIPPSALRSPLAAASLPLNWMQHAKLRTSTVRTTRWFSTQKSSACLNATGKRYADDLDSQPGPLGRMARIPSGHWAACYAVTHHPIHNG